MYIGFLSQFSQRRSTKSICRHGDNCKIHTTLSHRSQLGQFASLNPDCSESGCSSQCCDDANLLQGRDVLLRPSCEGCSGQQGSVCGRSVGDCQSGLKKGSGSLELSESTHTRNRGMRMYPLSLCHFHSDFAFASPPSHLPLCQTVSPPKSACTHIQASVVVPRIPCQLIQWDEGWWR